MDIKLMVPGLVGVVVFIIIFNVYHIIKNKKRNSHRSDTVDVFKTNYKKNVQKTSKQSDEYVKYITKYNSSVDFIDKNDFIKEASEQGKSQSRENPRKSLHNIFM